MTAISELYREAVGWVDGLAQANADRRSAKRSQPKRARAPVNLGANRRRNERKRLTDPMLVRADITLQPPHPFAGLRGGFYRAISVDPASRFKCRTALQVQNWSSRRDTEKHYHTMSFEELAALPVAELTSPDGCHLFVWTSGPFLPQAIALMGARRSNWDCWGDQVGFFGGAQS